MSSELRPAGHAFQAHPLLFNGHLQTLGGYYLGRKRRVEGAVRHAVPLADGDHVVLHDDLPPEWSAGELVVVLVHGLAGCHGSPYMGRMVDKLTARGVRTFRMDLRGCGAGRDTARLPYHSGRSDDLRRVLEYVAVECPGSPMAAVGYSLGGNILLKLLGEAPESVPAELVRGAAVSPPVDLRACLQSLGRGLNRLYDRYFVQLLVEQLELRRKLRPDLALPAGWQNRIGRPAGLNAFDEEFTAPVCGFASADDYYKKCSAGPQLGGIAIPTLIVTADDDPLVPSSAYDAVRLSPQVQLEVTRSGGHLGFLSQRSAAVPDGRWMDWRVLRWAMGESGRIWTH